MRYFILLLVLALNAHALTKEQAQRAMNGEDYNESKKVAVSECDHNLDCQSDEYCHKERHSDSKGVCVKKRKD